MADILRWCVTCQKKRVMSRAFCSSVNPFTANCQEWAKAEHAQHEHFYCSDCKTWTSDQAANRERKAS